MLMQGVRNSLVNAIKYYFCFQMSCFKLMLGTGHLCTDRSGVSVTQLAFSTELHLLSLLALYATAFVLIEGNLISEVFL